MSAEKAIVAAMRAGASTLSAIREATGLRAPEISSTVQSMRFAGKIAFDSLTLAPSMMIGNSAAAVTCEESPGHAAEAGREAPARGEEPDRGGGDVAHSSPPSRAIAEEVKAEAQAAGDRRRNARVIGTSRPLSKHSVATFVQTADDPEPSDIIQAVNRVHPELWRRCVALGRALPLSPFGTLYRAIEAGLTVLEADLAEDGAA